AALAAPASAHESSPQVRTEIERITPALPDGVEIDLTESISTQLTVVNRTDTPLEVLDAQGEPFLRIGPDGVQADITSAAWYETNDPTGVGGLPERIAQRLEGDPEPRFATVASEPSWGWFDHRMHPEPVTSVPTEILRDGRREVTLADWEVTLRYGEQEITVDGRLFFQPVLGRFEQRMTSPSTLGQAAFVQLLPGDVPALFVDNAGTEPITVLGREGEPFVRIGPAGVEVNVRSPSHVDDQRLQGESPEVAADADAQPLWREMADVPRYNWLEPRAAYQRERPPEEVLQSGESQTLLEWAVPVRLGDGTTREITGRTTWLPTSPPAVQGEGGGVPSALWVLGPLALLAALGGALLLRRRAGRARA
ncbi:MAG TPA: hypothetical protein VGW11_09655, partial [Solirubrobacteraceae bacterium]|nr:hypothetical protein [Solirubrobacteraceae bacterium]